MTPHLSDALDQILDRFEARVRRKWATREQRIDELHLRRLEGAMLLDDPPFRSGVVKPSLDYYDNREHAGGRKRGSF